MFAEAVHPKSPRGPVLLKKKTDVPSIKNVTLCENYRCGIWSFWSIFIWNITLHFAKFVVVEYGVLAQFMSKISPFLYFLFLTKNKTKKRWCTVPSMNEKRYILWKLSLCILGFCLIFVWNLTLHFLKFVDIFI